MSRCMYIPCLKLLSKSHKLQLFKFGLKKQLLNFKQSI